MNNKKNQSTSRSSSGIDTTQPAPATPSGTTCTPTVHFYILLDRSGSMESMRSDVIGGYNGFIAGQRNTSGQARVTLVQFDSQDDQELLLDAVSLDRVPELTAETFVPRGGTPLLDATATMIESIHGRRAVRRVLGRTPEEIVVVTVTDGEENQSSRYALRHVRRLVDAGKADGWSFVYLGAGLDAYGDAARMGYDVESVQRWKADGEGAGKMWGSLARASAQMRQDVASGRPVDKSAYFRGVKEAEQD